MTAYQIQILIIIILFLVQPLEILLTQKRYGIKHVNSFPWALLASIFSLRTLSVQSFGQSQDSLLMMIGLLIAIIITIIVSKIFNSYSYKVVDVAGLNLKPTLQKAIESTDMKVSEIEVVVDNKKNVYKIADSKKRIYIEIREKLLSKETYYILKFDRWVDRKSRHDILDYISDQMTRFELPKKKMSFKLIEATLFVAALIVLLGFFNARWLNETHYAIFDEKGMPELLTVTAFDKRIVEVKQDETFMISDPVIIKSFYDGFLIGEMNRNTYDELEDLSTTAYYRITYGNLSQSIYVLSSRCYMYIPFEAIRETSPVKRLMVDFYRLYGRQEGILYDLSYEFNTLETMRALLKGEL